MHHFLNLNWKEYLQGHEDIEYIRKSTQTGRPCGDYAFLKDLENKIGGNFIKNEIYL